MSVYFVGYLIKGEAARYYETITRDLSSRFGIKNLAEKIPPHFTLKAPFEAEDIFQFLQTMEKLSTTQKSYPLVIEGFGRLNPASETIYLAVREDVSLENEVTKIIETLEDFGKNKKPLPAHFKLHASIVRYLAPEQSQEIWKYLQTVSSPRFEVKFDNLTLFKYENHKWSVEKIYRFN